MGLQRTTMTGLKLKTRLKQNVAWWLNSLHRKLGRLWQLSAQHPQLESGPGAGTATSASVCLQPNRHRLKEFTTSLRKQSHADGPGNQSLPFWIVVRPAASARLHFADTSRFKSLLRRSASRCSALPAESSSRTRVSV